MITAGGEPGQGSQAWARPGLGWESKPARAMLGRESKPALAMLGRESKPALAMLSREQAGARNAEL